MKTPALLILITAIPYLAGAQSKETTKPEAKPMAPKEQAAVPNEEAKAEPAKFVTVGGEVRKPGQLQITENAQLYALVQSAGGANEFGSMRKVKVIRDGKTTEYDLDDDKQKTTPILPNDVIEIPKKGMLGR